MIRPSNNQPTPPYEPHLRLQDVHVPPGKEWRPQMPGLTLIQVASGTGYWLHDTTRLEVLPGALLLATAKASGWFLASQLGTMSLQTFNLVPERLTGLLTLGEQTQLRQATAMLPSGFRLLDAQDPLAEKMKAVCSPQASRGLLQKLHLLQILVQTLGATDSAEAAAFATTDAKERLRTILRELPPNALLEITFEKLAQMNNCTPRHLSRIFNEVVGMSFRDKRAEIRLSRARELLATSQTKVVEVALESGYRSVSLFNLMFTRRFGMSPGRWRQKNGQGGDGVALRRNRVFKSRSGGFNLLQA